MSKIKVGIFFGGPSREREISFAGGRTVYDNLNKSIFEAIPIFVDSKKNFILLNWENVYKGTIRDFFPPVAYLPPSAHGYQIYTESLDAMSENAYHDMLSTIGMPLSIADLASKIDIAFLALHGLFGEDGQIQALLQSLSIPFTGSGILPCALGMDKSEQKKFMEAGGFKCPKVITLNRNEWLTGDKKNIVLKIIDEIGTSIVSRPANQGSSIGVSIMHDSPIEEIIQNIDKGFFCKHITAAFWKSMSKDVAVEFIRSISDIRDGLGFPCNIGNTTIAHPETLLHYLDNHFSSSSESVLIESHHAESKVIVEAFIQGKEFSCIVIRNEDGKAVALPPTEIRKQGQLYDYRSKYLPGLSRKITPIDLPTIQIKAIRQECEKLYNYLAFDTYARIDGFITSQGVIILNDPNTTSGMMPSSFFFHQAAEIGLDPSQFLSYIIRASIEERIEESTIYNDLTALLNRLDESLLHLQSSSTQKTRVAVILGGYSFERHISLESGRNIYEKLASSEKYSPFPVFLMGHEDGTHSLWQIPINLLLKDNADDIKDKILHFSKHHIVQEIKKQCDSIYKRFKSSSAIEEPLKLTYQNLKERADVVFIALHGRPGEDGNVQSQLDAVGLPYNGSRPHSAAITINKFDTLQQLKAHGFTTTPQFILSKKEYDLNQEESINLLESKFSYPFLLKPVDDGCSSAVKIIKDRPSLKIYLDGLLRDGATLSSGMRDKLMLSYNEEFPKKEEVLVEKLITQEGAEHFLEITGGMLTHMENNQVRFEVFEPSEALAGGEILSLEEKFLAGEGQNITPARFSKSFASYEVIANQVKEDLKKAAQILNVEGYCRIDAFVRITANKAETIVIEINSLPGMTPATCIFHQCAINGYKPYDFIDKILTFAIQRNEYRK